MIHSEISYSKYFKHILPLSIHPLYTPDLEFSDKIVLPGSVSKDLLRNKLPFPPQFILIPERAFNNSLHCTSLDFSAEEGYIYLPLWMIKQLGFKVVNLNKGLQRSIKSGYGVTLNILEVTFTAKSIFYNIKKCEAVEYFAESEACQEDINEQLKRYLFIREDSEVCVKLNGVIVVVVVVKVRPEAIAVIQGEVEFKRLAHRPVPVEIPKKSFESVEVAVKKSQKFPKFTEKLPKFLVELINRKPKKIKNSTSACSEDPPKEPNHKKNYSFIPMDSGNILQSRTATPEFIEKYIMTQSKNIEVGKSLEESINILPPLYNSPNKVKINPPQILTITIPELLSNSNIRAKKKNIIPVKKKNWFSNKVDRSITPLMLKNIMIDGPVSIFSKSQKSELKGLKLY